MKTLGKHFLFMAITCLPVADVLALSFDRTTIEQLGLPLVEITTVNGEEPTCDYVVAPEGENGQSIINATKVPGRVVVSFEGVVRFDSGNYKQGESGMTIKIRGNTSAYTYYDKKPFKIKLQKKGDMLWRGDKRYNDKDWLLIKDGDYGFNTMASFLVARFLEVGWVPSYRYVNVIMNGDYRGIYMLVEAVERNADCRINVDKQQGFVIEFDAYWWKEAVYFGTSGVRKYTFKYPDDDDVTDFQISYIRQRVIDMEQSIINGNYHEHLHVPSWAKWVLCHDILGTSDAAGSNIFMTLYDHSPESRLMLTTPWDFNTTFRTYNAWSTVHSYWRFYFKELFESSNPMFRNVYLMEWRKVSPVIFSYVVGQLDQFGRSPEFMAISRSRNYDKQRWGYNLLSAQTDLSVARSWFYNRRKWMETQLGDK